MSTGRIRAVFLDVGETLVDETRVWEGWADWLGVPRFTFLDALGGLIQRGEDHLRVFELFRPDFDLARERAARREAGVLWIVQERDLYPDVRPGVWGGARLVLGLGSWPGANAGPGRRSYSSGASERRSAQRLSPHCSMRHRTSNGSSMTMRCTWFNPDR